MVPLRWLRSVPFTIQARQTAQDNPVQSPVQVQHLVPRCCREDHQTQLLISGGVERRLHLDLTVFKGQGHYPPLPGLFVCLIKRAGACRPRCLSRAGGASFNSVCCLALCSRAWHRRLPMRYTCMHAGTLHAVRNGRSTARIIKI